MRNGSGAVVTAEDIARGYRLASVSTNVAVSYSCPTNGATWASWSRRGAFRDWFALSFPGGWTFPKGTNGLGRVTVFADARIRPDLRAASDEIAALGQSASAVPGVSEFWSAATTSGSQVLTWRDFRYGRGAGESVDAQIELFPNGDFSIRSNAVERAYARIVPFDWDGDGLANDVDPEPYVNNGDHHGQTAAAKDSVLGEVGVGLDNGYYFLSATFPADPSVPTLVAVGTNRMVVVESGEYLFLLEKGIEYDIHVEPGRDDVVYDAFDDVLAAQNPFGPMLRSIEWWGPGRGDGGNWHGYSDIWTEAPGGLDFWPSGCWFDGYVAWWPGFKGSPDIPDLDPHRNCVFTGVFTDCHVDVPAQYEWKSAFWVLPIVSPHAKTTEVLAPPAALSNATILVTATYGGREYQSFVGGGYHLNTNGQVRAGYYVDVDPVVFRGGARRPLVVSAHTDDPDLLPLPTNGTVTLSFASGASHVRLWSAEEGGVEVSLPRSWPTRDFDGFTCYMEGLSDSTNIEHVVFLLSYSGDDGNMDDSAETYVCNPPIILAPRVVGVNDDDDNGNGTNDCDEVGALVGDDDVVPVRIVAQLPPDVGGSVKLLFPSLAAPRLWRDQTRSEELASGVTLSIPASGLLNHTNYIESAIASTCYNDTEIIVIASCGGSVATNSQSMTFVSRIAEPITTERVGNVIVNPCGAVTNAITLMKVDVDPEDFPDEKIVWSAVSGGVSFVGGNAGRNIAFKATGSPNDSIVLEVDFDGCPGRRPQFVLTACEMRSIPVYPCTITDGKHPSPITESHLASLLSEVNIIFRQVGLSFYLGAPITNVVNKTLTEKGLMNKVCQSQIRNILSNTGGVELYFIHGLESGDEMFKDQPNGSADKYGIIVRNSISATTLAHEIGHLCRWKDIFARGKRFIPDELDLEVSQQRLPNDWNNGTGGRFYPMFLSQSEAIRKLLMYGEGSASKADISAGNVYGLIIHRSLSPDGEIVNETYQMDNVYVGGVPPLRTPITR